MGRKLRDHFRRHKAADDKVHIVDCMDLESPVSCSSEEFHSSVYHNQDCYFSDGVRQIDFILVYEEQSRAEGRKRPTDQSKEATQRRKFLTNLAKAGVEMEEV
ncbi:hypothetical protein ACOMHN_005834 [Nucella lapillus]